MMVCSILACCFLIFYWFGDGFCLLFVDCCLFVILFGLNALLCRVWLWGACYMVCCGLIWFAFGFVDGFGMVLGLGLWWLGCA